MRDNDGELHYMLTDHLGSVVAITNSTGGVEYEQRYLPFGGVRELGDYSTTQPVTDFTYTGQRSLDAAKALEDAGYQLLINIVDGFEGALDEHKHRGNLGGWRYQGLPWEQS